MGPNDDSLRYEANRKKGAFEREAAIHALLKKAKDSASPSVRHKLARVILSVAIRLDPELVRQLRYS
jgi:hypothetical protein